MTKMYNHYLKILFITLACVYSVTIERNATENDVILFSFVHVSPFVHADNNNNVLICRGNKNVFTRHDCCKFFYINKFCRVFKRFDVYESM